MDPHSFDPAKTPAFVKGILSGELVPDTLQFLMFTKTFNKALICKEIKKICKISLSPTVLDRILDQDNIYVMRVGANNVIEDESRKLISAMAQVLIPDGRYIEYNTTALREAFIKIFEERLADKIKKKSEDRASDDKPSRLKSRSPLWRGGVREARVGSQLRQGR